MTARWEQITGRPEGGWIATGACGRPHLIGRGWWWWRCPTCEAIASREQITPEQTAALAA